jgi:O-antigen biosynthesis protein
MSALRVGLLVHELGRSGGMGVIAAHARALVRDPRFEPVVVVTGGGGAPPASLDGVPVAALGAGMRFDVAVATWWQTCFALWEVEAATRVVFLQSLEERFYPEEDLFERIGAASVLGLPVHYVAVASWLADVVVQLRPRARCVVVRNGIDKGVFRAGGAGAAGLGAPLAASPDASRLLRVLVEGQPTLWFKAVHEAAAAVRAMREPATLTVVAPTEEGLAEVDADRREAGLDPAGMAALYAEHDVLLKLSRVESLGLPPLEAMHAGTPSVLAPYTGHEEYAVHGENSLLVGYDDEPGTAAALDALARDAGLRARLRDGALATAARWPGVEEAGAAFCDALAALHAAPGPDAGDAARAMQRSVRAWTELGRHWPGHVRGRLAWREHELADTRAHLDEVNAARRELEARIEAIKSERAYRLAGRLRRLMPGRDE